ncbi:unnamed protein product [Clonostachys chloroleuca]|uniref:Kinesin light chain n=1 Tax=Clonostachys chloroleuca TaxID=1926264 RepID=A0AA35Q6X6_9HYPO|nr:unnamed protein product [Clonostachys chloroleuca]
MGPPSGTENIGDSLLTILERLWVSSEASNKTVVPELCSIMHTRLLPLVIKEGLGRSYPATLTCISNLAGWYQQLGKFDTAEQLGLKAVIIRQAVLGDDYPHTLFSISNLAIVKELQVKVVTAIKNQLGEEYPKTLLSEANLAATFLYLEIERQTLEKKERILGEEHTDTLTSVANLASIYIEQYKYKEAKTLLVRVIGIKKRQLGLRYPETLSSISNLASLYLLQDK